MIRSLSTSRRLWNLLTLLLGEDYRPFWLWTGVLAAVYVLNLLPAYFVGRVVDLLTQPPTESTSNRIALLCVALSGVWIFASFIRLQAKAVLNGFTVQVGYRARVYGFERLMNHSIEWHEQESTGNKVQRIQAGSLCLRELLGLFHSDLLVTATSAVGILVSFSFFGFQFGLAGISYLGLFAYVQVIFYRRVRGTLQDSKAASENASGVYTEGTSNILTVKTLNVASTIGTNIIDREQKARDLKLRVDNYIYWKWRCFQLVNGGMLGGFVYLVANRVLRGEVSAGSLLILFTFLRTLIEIAGDSTNFVDVIADKWVTVERMLPIFENELNRTTGNKLFPIKWDSIKLKSIFAHYGDKGLHDFSCVIPRGTSIGIIGESGAGKSTLARVLIGIKIPNVGTYSVGEISFWDISPNERAAHIAIVLQESELFNLSLRDNITVMREVSEARLREAITIAQLEPVIAKLPEGLDTVIGEKGYRLSGGERQRIGIARALCKSPDIIILDEATSALDDDTEAAVHEAIVKDFVGKTTIIIAHRFSTLRNVDQVIELHGGKVVRSGTYEELCLER